MCEEIIDYEGLTVYPAPLEEMKGPAGALVDLAFSKNSYGEGPHEDWSDVLAVGGDCQVVLLFRVPRGETKTATLEVGQVVVVTSGAGGPENSGYFPVDIDSEGADLG